ncbi:MAG: type II toxin-antitoxin system RelE/ParE family toxin [Rhizomicrobium sp.]
MAFRVIVAASAVHDIDDIHVFISQNTGAIAADRVIDALEKRIATLAVLPRRGNVPKELAATGRKDFRELHFKPYRIFYKVSVSVVEVVAVLDGRRDMSTLLRQRLTR